VIAPPTVLALDMSNGSHFDLVVLLPALILVVLWAIWRYER
jgi:hypothetical protein